MKNNLNLVAIIIFFYWIWNEICKLIDSKSSKEKGWKNEKHLFLPATKEIWVRYCKCITMDVVQVHLKS